MKKGAFALLILLVVLSGNKKLFSQNSLTYNPIQTVVPFLSIAPDSRAGGMGDVGVATSPDVYSMHWNPAKFAFIDGQGGVGISYIPWLRNLVPDINIAYLAGYKRIDSKQVISASLLYSSLGRVELTDEYAFNFQDINPNEFSLDAAYSRLFSEHLSGGIAFRFIYSNLTNGVDVESRSTKSGISFAADISGYYKKDISIFNKNGLIGIGLNFSNIGSKMNYAEGQPSDFIPTNMRLGASGTIFIDPRNKLTVALDFNKLLVPTDPIYSSEKPDSIIDGKDPNVSVPVAMFHSFYDAPGGFKEEMHEITISTGVEYWYMEQFAMRVGYFNETESKGNRKYFTLGAGFKWRIYSLNFSYLVPITQNNPLARTLRFSLAFDFNAKKNPSKSKG